MFLKKIKSNFNTYKIEFIYGSKIGKINGMIKNKNVLEIPCESVIPDILPVF